MLPAKPFHQPKAPGNARAQGHQRVHGGLAMEQLEPGPFEKTTARGEDHHPAEQRLKPPVQVNHHPGHHGTEKRQREGPRQQGSYQGSAQFALFFFPGGVHHESVTPLCQGLRKLFGRNAFKGDRGLFAGQVYRRAGHSGHSLKSLLHAPHAGRAGHALNTISTGIHHFPLPDLPPAHSP